MMLAVEIDGTGEMVCLRTGSDPERLAQSVAAGNSLLSVPAPDVPSWWDGTSWRAKPDSPSPAHAWDGHAKKWTDPRTIAQHKSAKLAAIKAARATAETAPLVLSGKTWQVDQQSREAIRVQLDVATQVGATWSTTWTFADNTRGTVTATNLRAVLLAFGLRADAAHKRLQSLRTLVDAAVSVSQITAITW